MTQEEQLLMVDLCGRLPYGVICEDEYGNALELNSIDKPNTVTFKCSDKTFWTTDLDKCKPYLFPMSSMTEEQKNEYLETGNYVKLYDINNVWIPSLHTFEWLDANHFDYRGLIPKDLANDATNLGIY